MMEMVPTPGRKTLVSLNSLTLSFSPDIFILKVNTGPSSTDTALRMEENPIESIAHVIEFLKTSRFD